jgi:hypothetical protein
VVAVTTFSLLCASDVQVIIMSLYAIQPPTNHLHTCWSATG